MTGAIGLDPPAVESAVRKLELTCEQISAALALGSNTLASVDIGDWFNAAFSRIESAADYVNLGRFDLQQTYAGVLLADMGVSAADLCQVLGKPLGDVTLDQLLEAMPRAALKAVRDIINEGDDPSMSKHELDLVYDKVSGLSDKDRAYVLTHLTDEENARLFQNVHSDDWSDAKQIKFYDLYQCVTTLDKSRLGQFSPYLGVLADAEGATAVDQAARDALETLRTDDAFKLVSFDQRIALLAQAGNYPNVKSITRLGQLADQDWFQESSLEHSQLSAKSIAYFASNEKGDQVIIDNTLDLLVGPDSKYSLVWEPKSSPRTFGNASGETISLNVGLLSAGNDSVANSLPEGVKIGTADHLIFHTIAHEINHLVTKTASNSNGTSPQTFARFMDEYRAWWVGFRAEHGHDPTQRDAARRFQNQLGHYRSLNDVISKGEDGQLAGQFVNQVLDPPVNLEPPVILQPGLEPVSTQALIVARLNNVSDPAGAAPPPIAVPSDPLNNNLTNG